VTRAGWILEPVRDIMTVAEEGGGTFREGEKLSVAAPAPLAHMSGWLGYRMRRDPEVSAKIGKLSTMRCAGCEHVALASGRSHFSYYRRSMPWDHAAGVLMHREAGGYSATIEGKPYSPAGGPDQAFLMAPDRMSWQSLRDLVASALQR
jgi:fructose-1,6-bisphosphatase/inositol monophosphatase family enzyme